MEDSTTTVERVLSCLETINAFAYEDYASQTLCELCLDKGDILTPAASQFFGEDLHGTPDRFKVETIAFAVSGSSHNAFRRAVVKVSFPILYSVNEG
jgi:hypothetical protein